MYARYMYSELKKWRRDSLMGFMLIYPILFGVIGRYVVPWVEEMSGFPMDTIADYILVVLVLLTPQVYGALIGFSILNDRDDHVLTSVRVTPLSIHQFLLFKLVLVFVLSFVACLYVMWFSDIGGFRAGEMAAISFLASLAAPMTGLMINALAQNKIEGFAVMKGIGILIIFPFIALFFVDAKELLFAFAPGFWPAKAISSIIRGEDLLLLSYGQYVWIGLVYVALLNVLTYRFFVERIKV
ncbi:MAG: ABC transporter permease [Bacillaceae bacterium]|nr:ABC transporter permease [Bacillaceae bacterium]